MSLQTKPQKEVRDMATMTKAQYFSLPKNVRKKHKDGTYWASIRVPGSPTSDWVQVKWLS